MLRRVHLTLKLTRFDTPLTKKGAKVHRGEPLIRVTQEEVVEFDLTRLLKIAPSDLGKFLLVKEGDAVKVGTVIARKSGVLSKQQIKTPVEGKLVILSRDQGIIGVSRSQKDQEVTAWFDGEVTEVSRDKIVFTVTGVTLPAREGKGAPTSGKLLVLPETNVLELPAYVNECVVVVKDADPATIAKADTLGATAFIAENLDQPAFSLPYLLMEDISPLAKFHERSVIVLGDEKQLLVLEEEPEQKKKLPIK